MRPLRSILLSLALVGCAGSPTPLEHSPPVHEAPSTPKPESSVAPPIADAAAPTASDAAPAAVTLLSFRRVVEAPVHSIALGKNRIAALGADAWLDDGSGFKKLPAVPAKTERVRIFFGRDNQPRLMGAADDASVYLRFQNGAWKSGASGIGRLGTGPRAPLYGVLGWDDPEVVCKPGDKCIIKRLSGWTTIDALPGLPDVVLAGPTAWAFENATVRRLDKDHFVTLEAKSSFTRADGLWAPAPDDVWVAESASSSLHHFDGRAWTRQASPIAGPKRLWAASATDVWVVGEGGAGHFDGKTWSSVAGVSGAQAFVIGRSASEVLIAGSTGLLRGTK